MLKVFSALKTDKRAKMLAVAIAVLLVTSALFGVSLALKARTTTVTNIGTQAREIGDYAFSDEELIIGTASTSGDNRVYALDTRTGEEKWTVPTESYVRKVKSFGSFIAVGLENKKIMFLQSDGSLCSQSEFLYPIVDFDYSAENGTLAVAGSVTQSTNAVFVLRDFRPQVNYGERDYTYYVASNVYPIGVTVTEKGVYFAGGNSKVYRCTESGRATEVLESGYTQNSFLRIGERFVLGYVNGMIDVFEEGEEGFAAVKRFKLGKKEVVLSAVFGSDGMFCAAEKGGNLAFYRADKLSQTAKGKGVTLFSRLAVSESGTAALLKNNGFIFADEDKIGVAHAFSIVFIPAVILFAAALLWTLYCVIRLLPRHGARIQSAAKRLGRDIWKDRKCYLLLLPAFAFMAVFVFWPIVQGFTIAFQDYVPGVRAEWVGFANFAEVFRNSYFWSSLKNMVILLVTDLFKALVPPFIIAECIIALVNKRSQYAARVMMYIPGILPGLAGVLLWTSGILGADGVLSQLFGALGIERFANYNWLGNEATALWGLILIGFPWVGSYIILYGALMSVPKEYYDAAKLDGFTWIKRIWYIDLPMIRPQLKYIFVLGFIGSVQDFQRVYMTTGGSFGTNIPALEIFYNINTFNNYGVAAAMGVLLFAVIFVATLINMRVKTE